MECKNMGCARCVRFRTTIECGQSYTKIMYTWFVMATSPWLRHSCCEAHFVQSTSFPPIPFARYRSFCTFQRPKYITLTLFFPSQKHLTKWRPKCKRLWLHPSTWSSVFCNRLVSWKRRTSRVDCNGRPFVIDFHTELIADRYFFESEISGTDLAIRTDGY